MVADLGQFALVVAEHHCLHHGIVCIMIVGIVCTMACALFEPWLLEDASQLLGTAGFGGWKICKDACQLLVSTFVRSVASLTGRDSIDANATVLFNLLWRNLEEALMKTMEYNGNKLQSTIVYNGTYVCTRHLM